MAKEAASSPRARITVRVQPRAKVSRIAGRMENAFRLQLAAPPVDGKANEACIAFLADLADVPRSQVRIVSGVTSRTKIVEIQGVAQEEMTRRLAG